MSSISTINSQKKQLAADLARLSAEQKTVQQGITLKLQNKGGAAATFIANATAGNEKIAALLAKARNPKATAKDRAAYAAQYTAAVKGAVDGQYATKHLKSEISALEKALAKATAPAGPKVTAEQIAHDQAAVKAAQTELTRRTAYINQGFSDIAKGQNTAAAKDITQYFGDFGGKSAAVDKAVKTYNASKTAPNLRALAKTIQPVYLANAQYLGQQRTVLKNAQNKLAADQKNYHPTTPTKPTTPTTPTTPTKPSTPTTPSKPVSAAQLAADKKVLADAQAKLKEATDYTNVGFADIAKGQTSTQAAATVVQYLGSFAGKNAAVDKAYATYKANPSTANLQATAKLLQPVYLANSTYLLGLRASVSTAQKKVDADLKAGTSTTPTPTPKPTPTPTPKPTPTPTPPANSAQVAADQQALTQAQGSLTQATAYTNAGFADIAQGQTSSSAAQTVVQFLGAFGGRDAALDKAVAAYQASPTLANLQATAKLLQPIYLRDSSYLQGLRADVAAAQAKLDKDRGQTATV